MNVRRICVRLTLAICAALLVAGAGVSSAADMNTDQLVKYYRKKANIGPTQNVAVSDVKDSPIKGVKQGTLTVGDGPQARKLPFIASDDGRYVVIGPIEDTTSDPAKERMQKISLKGKPAKGPANAKVTIVEYSDFQCPFCSRGYETIEKQVLPKYSDKVRFVYKNFPLNFHPWAEPAALNTTCAAKQDEAAYWKLYTYYFEHQKEITPQNLKEKTEAELKGTKVDMAKFNTCVDNKETLEEVRAEMAEGQSVGVTGTPGFIVNGRLVSGAQPAEVFINIIDDELSSAK